MYRFCFSSPLPLLSQSPSPSSIHIHKGSQACFESHSWWHLRMAETRNIKTIGKNDWRWTRIIQRERTRGRQRGNKTMSSWCSHRRLRWYRNHKPRKGWYENSTKTKTNKQAKNPQKPKIVTLKKADKHIVILNQATLSEGRTKRLREKTLLHTD